jgi:hypothetical protein
MAEFSYNNSIHSSIGYTPFFANTGRHPRWMMLEYVEDSNNPAIIDHLKELKEIQLKLTDHLRDAQAKYKKAADQDRLNSSTETPKFRIGDRVWLL